MTAVLSVATWVIYVAAYTPMKTRTLNTAVTVSGALPVLMGWAAVEGSWVDARWMALFLLVFFWQFYFMAIAHIYRKQYGEAGMKMWTVVDPHNAVQGLRLSLGVSGFTRQPGYHRAVFRIVEYSLC